MPNINGETFDPIMGQTVPSTSTPGDLYAVDIQNDLLLHVAPHTHTGPNNLDGYQLNADALHLTQDINLNDTNLDAARSIRFSSQSTTLSGSQDINSIYDTLGDIYANDGLGNVIRITQNGTLAVSGANQSLNPTSVTSNLTIPPVVAYNLLNVNTTSGAITIKFPVAATQSPGRFFYFNDIVNSFATHNCTISVATGSGNVIIAKGATYAGGSIALTSNGNSGIIYTDGVSKWYILFFEQFFYTNENLEFISSTIQMDGNSTLSLPFNINNPSSGTFTPQLQCEVEVVSGGQIDATVANAVIASAAGGVTSNIGGGITTSTASGIQSGAVGGIQLNAGSTDWVTFSATRTHFVATPLIPAQGSLTSGWTASTTDVIGIFGPATTSIQPLSLPVQHNGSTLQAITIYLKVSTHSGPPATFPSMQVKRRDLVSGIGSDVFLSSTNQQFTSGTWTSGLVTNFTYTTNQNNVIDTSQYLYFVELVDENGSGSASNNNYYGMLLTFGLISNNQFQ